MVKIVNVLLPLMTAAFLLASFAHADGMPPQPQPAPPPDTQDQPVQLQQDVPPGFSPTTNVYSDCNCVPALPYPPQILIPIPLPPPIYYPPPYYGPGWDHRERREWRGGGDRGRVPVPMPFGGNMGRGRVYHRMAYEGIPGCNVSPVETDSTQIILTAADGRPLFQTTNSKEGWANMNVMVQYYSQSKFFFCSSPDTTQTEI